jgi:hypothetical protein
MATGVNVSKANLYAVLTPPAGVGVSKANLYAALTPPAGVGVSKANLYAVLYPTPSSPALPMSARVQVLFGQRPWRPTLARRFAPPAAAASTIRPVLFVIT